MNLVTMYPARLNSLKFMLLLLALIASARANAGLFSFGGDSWKEEVLLHDGRKIIVERSQIYGGRHEIGQASPVKSHSIRFALPLSGRTITWRSEYSEELGRTNLNVLALHILEDTPYLITEPNLCLSYNKWGRPNPPYVIFKHDGQAWQQIELVELPGPFEKINLIVNNGRIDSIKAAARGAGYVSVHRIDEINNSLTQPQYKGILKGALEKSFGNEACPPMVHYKCGWFGTNPDGTFNKDFADRMCKR